MGGIAVFPLDFSGCENLANFASFSWFSCACLPDAWLCAQMFMGMVIERIYHFCSEKDAVALMPLLDTGADVFGQKGNDNIEVRSEFNTQKPEARNPKSEIRTLESQAKDHTSSNVNRTFLDVNLAP